MAVHILAGDCRHLLGTLAPGSVQTCVTSPPYFGLRDYGVTGQIGLEPSVDEYVAQLVDVFRAVRDVLADDGTLWLNLGDSYCASPPGNKTVGVSARSKLHGVNGPSETYRQTLAAGHATKRDTSRLAGLKPKDLIGIPWRVAFALQADGWWLRSDIVWHKPNPMPESVTDRPTKAHEYVFLLTKRDRYYYDADAIAEPAIGADRVRADRIGGNKHGEATTKHSDGSVFVNATSRNARSVWAVTTRPYAEAHFATFPPELPERCIKAGSRPGDTVLDPFGGAGTTGLVADRLGRNAVLIELNPEYADMAKRRIASDAPMFAEVL